ncbi:unnamed protein product [Spodoptera littoralis]|uniref:Uncharacterized protein n=1 Tax=Spodoptera littoralis TaxID=7109 RepID=A0A9P0ICT1_SPOLI|nr:unnamed protein product [Spodoptera littoralis]CAH1642855.1 unnamed protein product [Spodoptera littoralis]
MPEPKEKEPLLAELEVVGRLPLSQLDGASGVRRSRSWYLCCPNVPTRRSPASPLAILQSATCDSAPCAQQLCAAHAYYDGGGSELGREDVASLRAERDALARALAAERQRAATAARAHDARLAELHGVIAELVRRRAHDKHARAIPEEDVSDECESTTQPAGELDNDADHSRTDQNDTSSALSPELPTPQESKVENTIPATFEDLPTDTETSAHDIKADCPRVEVTTPSLAEQCDTSLNLSERDSDLCLSTARCCDNVVGSDTLGGGASGAGGGASEEAGGSCERERGSPDSPTLYTPCTGRCESRQAKMASRVKLRKTEESDSSSPQHDDWWSADKLSVDVCAHAELREALLAAQDQEGGCVWAARCARLRAERRVLHCALARAADTAHRLYCACAVSESTSVSLCCALRAADRALETYDVLLALAETAPDTHSHQRAATEQVALQLLARLESDGGTLGQPLLSPGPWLQALQGPAPAARWGPQLETKLRAHAARLKADTVSLRDTAPAPKLFSYHDVDEAELLAAGRGCSAAEMEDAVALHDALHRTDTSGRKSTSSRRSRRPRPRHWLDTQASETDL